MDDSEAGSATQCPGRRTRSREGAGERSIDRAADSLPGEVVEQVATARQTLLERCCRGSLPGNVVEQIASDQLYDALHAESHRLVVLLEPGGTVVDANEAALGVDDLDREAVVGKMLWETPWFRDTEPRQIENDVQRVVETSQLVEGERTLQDGSRTAIVELSFSPIPGTEEPVTLVLVSGTEITEQRRRIAELERHKERLDEFARAVSHDVRGQLSTASAKLALAKEQTDVDELHDVERSLDRIDTLLEDMLSVAREGRRVDERAERKLGIVANEAWENVETGDATLSIKSSPIVAADESRLMQMFENLFRNAIEHAEADVVRVGALDDGFYVEDDGPGLPADVSESVFEAGVTTAPDGTGFGLSIVESIVLAHDWWIDATDGDAGGARFEISTGTDQLSP
jgi:signal transduction histidine kinase